LLPPKTVLIRRCAWHRVYHGYRLPFGIASSGGWRVSFTDGMCLGCAARFRREWSLPPLKPSPTPVVAWLVGAAIPRAAVAFVALATLVLAARPLDDLRTPRAVTPALSGVRPLVTVSIPPELVPRPRAAARPRAVVLRRATRAVPSWPHAVPPVAPPVYARIAPPEWPGPPSRSGPLVIASGPMHAGLTTQTP